jgi:hypothetical protein
MRIRRRIQHLLAMRHRIRIRIQIQCFDDQKLEKIYSWNKIKDVKATGEAFIPQKKTSNTSKLKFSSFLWVILARIRIDPYFRIPNANPYPEHFFPIHLILHHSFWITHFFFLLLLLTLSVTCHTLYFSFPRLCFFLARQSCPPLLSVLSYNWLSQSFFCDSFKVSSFFSISLTVLSKSSFLLFSSIF